MITSDQVIIISIKKDSENKKENLTIQLLHDLVYCF